MILRTLICFLFFSNVLFAQENLAINQKITNGINQGNIFIIKKSKTNYLLQNPSYQENTISGNLQLVEDIDSYLLRTDSSVYLLIIKNYTIIDSSHVSIKTSSIQEYKTNIHGKWKNSVPSKRKQYIESLDTNNLTFGVQLQIGKFNPELFNRESYSNPDIYNYNNFTLNGGLIIEKSISKRYQLESGFSFSYKYISEYFSYCAYSDGWCSFAQRYTSEKQLTYLSIPFLLIRRSKYINLICGIKIGTLLFAKRTDQGMESIGWDANYSAIEIDITNEQLEAKRFDGGAVLGLNVNLNNHFGLRSELYYSFIDSKITKYLRRTNKTLTLGINYTFSN